MIKYLEQNTRRSPDALLKSVTLLMNDFSTSTSGDVLLSPSVIVPGFSDVLEGENVVEHTGPQGRQTGSPLQAERDSDKARKRRLNSVTESKTRCL